MAIGSISNPNMSFDEWLKAENKTGEVKQRPQQIRPGAVTDNGVPVHLANELHSGKTIFQVAAQNPTKETAGANGASSAGAGTQPSGIGDGGSNGVNNVPGGNDNNVQGASATGHTPQSQAPVLASGLQATQGGDNTGAQGGATSNSKQLNQNLYAQYEAAMREARVADQGGEVSTGEGTLSTGSADGAGATDGTTGPQGADGAQGADGTGGVDGGVNPAPTDPTTTNPSDPANSPPDDSGNNENPNDTSNDNSSNINKQEENRQEEILDSRRFHKLDEEAA